MYVNYEYYANNFGVVPEADFAKVEGLAEAHIRALTYIHGDVFANESDAVKQAVCAAADVVYAHQKAVAEGSAMIRSESNDGYSVSYASTAQDGQTADQVLRKKILEAVRIYLLPSGWLSRVVKMGGGCRYDSTDCHCNL